MGKKVLLVTQYFYPENFKCNDIAFDLVKRGYEVDALVSIPNYPQGKYFEGYGIFRKRRERVDGVNIYRAFQIPRGNGGVIRFYATAIAGVMTLLMTLKAYGKSVPIISYFGRYSIVILYTSFWIYNPLRFIAEKVNIHGGWIVFIVTMIVEYFVIKVFVKYLPYVTAQKDLIPVKK